MKTNQLRTNRISILFSLTALLFFPFITKAQVKAYSSGKVYFGGISTTPNYLIDLATGTNFDVNTGTTNGYRINGSYALWNKGHNENIFVGFGAGASTTGLYNSFVGYGAGNANITGDQNTAFGNSALNTQTSGQYNVAIGNHAMRYSTGTIRNTACGYVALYSTTSASGQYTTGMGYAAGMLNTTGGFNTFIGANTGGANNATGNNSTFVGYGAISASSYNNATALGNGAIATASNAIILGNSSITALKCNTTTVTALSDGRFKTNVTENVKGLEFINKLRPITYNLNTEALDDFIIQDIPDSSKALHKLGMDFAPSMSIVHSGFIAQEVEQAAQQVGFNSSIVYHPANETDPYGLGYAEFVVPLVKAVQELSKTVDSLKTAMNTCCTINESRSAQSSANSSSQTSIKQTDVKLTDTQTIVLEQNVPNPFAEQTAINYSLPDNTLKAQMLFYSAHGKLIQSTELTQKGKGTLNVFASDLSSGIYTYTLVVDGKIIETKKMVKQ